MRAGADAEVIAELPVIQVVLAGAVFLREGRGFVMRIAGGGKALFDGDLHRSRAVIVR